MFFTLGFCAKFSFVFAVLLSNPFLISVPINQLHKEDYASFVSLLHKTRKNIFLCHYMASSSFLSFFKNYSLHFSFFLCIPCFHIPLLLLLFTKKGEPKKNFTFQMPAEGKKSVLFICWKQAKLLMHVKYLYNYLNLNFVFT
jgi:hypothetical protein